MQRDHQVFHQDKVPRKEGATPAKGKKRKNEGQRLKREDDEFNEGEDKDIEEDKKSAGPAPKKRKYSYKISKEWKELIDKDEDNKNLWAQVKTKKAGNKKELLDKLEANGDNLQELKFQSQRSSKLIFTSFKSPKETVVRMTFLKQSRCPRKRNSF